MIIGIGIDLVRISRIQEMLKRWEDRFLNRVFTPSEIVSAQKKKSQHIPSQGSHPSQAAFRLSGLFAVKEAVLKGLGIGFQMGVGWQEIETWHNNLGKPVTTLSGKVQQIAREQGVSEIFVSLSHEGDYAIAQVILTGSGTETCATRNMSQMGLEGS
jgi:holo-[acyl-carrier protein] synthase